MNCFQRLSALGPADARIVTGGVLVSTGVSKQRGACRGACPRKTRALANL